MSPPALAYIPFLDPIDAHTTWWLFLVPLAFGISMVYKAVRIPAHDLPGYWKQVLVMTGQIVGAMLLLAVGLYLFVQVYVRAIADHAV